MQRRHLRRLRARRRRQTSFSARRRPSAPAYSRPGGAWPAPQWGESGPATRQGWAHSCCYVQGWWIGRCPAPPEPCRCPPPPWLAGAWTAALGEARRGQALWVARRRRWSSQHHHPMPLPARKPPSLLQTRPAGIYIGHWQ
ncbi:hypothetical protein F751_2496 [Auxenochlorella protothecoides]|uniref:Uncharacterized protein n=1 Tax=Auxenochlorella protothecoides TaxID=3075 RepID=A0A087SIV0_AUXPR|nr:hypothetical protein F751_2496 [Auxenochlorella protothecoides]KFM25654.1 hypothetical protein F751_2496 [Auxenochlorella protothecoides]